MFDKFLEKKVKKLEKRNQAFFAMSRLKRMIKYPIAFFYLGFLRRTVSFLVKIGFLSSVVGAETFWGDRMKIVLPGDFLIYWWGFYGEYEFSLSKFILNNLKEGDIFIDGGAHIGYFSLLASRAIGSGGKVHSFEPTPSVFSLLEHNVSNKKNIIINNCALWKNKDTIDFNDFGLAEGSLNSILSLNDLKIRSPLQASDTINFRNYKINSVALDDYCVEKNIKPSFIKLDTEGSETDILMGAVRVLKKFRPIVCLEVWGSSFKTGIWKRTADFMTTHSYKPFWLTKEGEIVSTSRGFINSSIAVFIPIEKI